MTNAVNITAGSDRYNVQVGYRQSTGTITNAIAYGSSIGFAQVYGG
jgi:hypothetical protein